MEFGSGILTAKWNEVNGARQPPVQGSGPTVCAFMGAELGLGTYGGKSISRRDVWKHLKHMEKTVLDG